MTGKEVQDKTYQPFILRCVKAYDGANESYCFMSSHINTSPLKHIYGVPHCHTLGLSGCLWDIGRFRYLWTKMSIHLWGGGVVGTGGGDKPKHTTFRLLQQCSSLYIPPPKITLICALIQTLVFMHMCIKTKVSCMTYT